MFVTVFLWLLCLVFVAGAFAARSFCRRNPVVTQFLLAAGRAWVRTTIQGLWPAPPEPQREDHVHAPGDLKILSVNQAPGHVLVCYAYRDMRYEMALAVHELHPDDFEAEAQVVRILRAQKPAGDIVLRIERASGRVTDSEHEQVVKLFGPFGNVQDPEGFFSALRDTELFQDCEPVFVTCLDNVFLLDFVHQSIIRETTTA